VRADLVVRFVVVLVGAIDIALAFAWRFSYRRRQLDALTHTLDDEDAEARTNAAESLVRLGLDRAARPLLAHVAHEDNPAVRAVIALAVARRQWEPAAVPGVNELRAWSAEELDARGIPVVGFGPALTRLADMGGPRRPDDGPRPPAEPQPAPVKKPVAKKRAPAKKTPAKKAAVKKTPLKKAPIKKAAIKKKAPAKKTTNPRAQEAEATQAAVKKAVAKSGVRTQRSQGRRSEGAILEAPPRAAAKAKAPR
jgi:hypothetical protein